MGGLDARDNIITAFILFNVPEHQLIPNFNNSLIVRRALWPFWEVGRERVSRHLQNRGPKSHKRCVLTAMWLLLRGPHWTSITTQPRGEFQGV